MHDAFPKLQSFLPRKPPIGCPICTCWSLDVNDDRLGAKPPDDYPIDMLSDTKMLRPRRITHESLQAAIQIAHGRVTTGEWTPKQGKSYLMAEGYSSYAVEQIVGNALRSREYNE